MIFLFSCIFLNGRCLFDSSCCSSACNRFQSFLSFCLISLSLFLFEFCLQSRSKVNQVVDLFNGRQPALRSNDLLDVVDLYISTRWHLQVFYKLVTQSILLLINFFESLFVFLGQFISYVNKEPALSVSYLLLIVLCNPG